MDFTVSEMFSHQEVIEISCQYMYIFYKGQVRRKTLEKCTFHGSKGGP